jgi:hypothetical protein
MMKKAVLGLMVLGFMATGAHANLFVNGDFSVPLNTVATDWFWWNADGGGIGTALPTSAGAGQGQIQITGGELHNNNATASQYGYFRVINTTPGVTYTLTADWRNPTGIGASNEWVELNWVDTNSNHTSTAGLAQIINNLNGWPAGAQPGQLYKKDTFAGVHPKGATSPWTESLGPGLEYTLFSGRRNKNSAVLVATGNRSVIHLKSGHTGGSTFYDNISFVPEPATLSLLALGGLAILRRRQRK